MKTKALVACLSRKFVYLRISCVNCSEKHALLLFFFYFFIFKHSVNFLELIVCLQFLSWKIQITDWLNLYFPWRQAHKLDDVRGTYTLWSCLHVWWIRKALHIASYSIRWRSSHPNIESSLHLFYSGKRAELAFCGQSQRLFFSFKPWCQRAVQGWGVPVGFYVFYSRT